MHLVYHLSWLRLRSGDVEVLEHLLLDKLLRLWIVKQVEGRLLCSQRSARIRDTRVLLCSYLAHLMTARSFIGYLAQRLRKSRGSGRMAQKCNNMTCLPNHDLCARTGLDGSTTEQLLTNVSYVL